ncbi:MAG TPA: PSD1 and planctomycete cytochrome C domain-containing protein [Planctomycetota bacterium]|nr:PSD1 and planctomycete cytochrome C domain-containing protein [Planctomycetota bacterium]
MMHSLVFLLAAAAQEPAVEHFEKKVRPVLHASCVPCHGPEKQKGGLRLDSRAGLQKGGDSGAVVVAGDPDKSLLMKAVRQTDPDLVMPPKKAAKKLPDAVLEDLAAWIRAGAPFPADASASRSKHWAFEPPGVPDPRTSIDSRLGPSGPAADRRTLLRRATYDLTGLPPTADEADRFAADDSPDAFPKVLDRLLASPAYGERWGRKWLDIVRYADTAGENSDHPAPHAWRYRNYVIDAFNADKPYDQFLREQIAGDLLAKEAPPERRGELVTATGFLAVARRFGHDTDKDMHLTYEDILDTMGKSVLGLTIGCARCHNHKYDPITTRDYYGLFGILASTRFPFPGCEPKQQPRDLVPLAPAAGVEVALKPRRDELARLEAEVKRLTAEIAAVPDPGELPAWLADSKRKREEAARVIPPPDFAYAVAEGKAADVPIQLRGEPDQPGETAPRRNLELLGGQKISDAKASGRLDLAAWLSDPANPLTARVMVNRIWQGHFGRGIVETPSDFGTRGAAPSDRELLDFLAVRFRDSGWSMKAMHRLILMSAAYQQASDATPVANTTGAYSSRSGFPRRRLDAEEIRDSLLAVSGELDRTPGRGHPFPPEGSWNFTQHNPFKAVYESPKRSVYLMTQRIQRHPFLALFDGPDTNASTARRDVSTVPTQALYFMNDPFFHARAEAVAKGLLALPRERRVEAAHRLCFQRSATASELRSADGFVAACGAELKSETAVWATYVRTLLASNEFLFLD